MPMNNDICIITARGGSKRVPRKNVRLFNGQPLVAWATSIAVSSGLFSDVIISTEDDEIAHVAIEAGAIFPFRRPTKLADDFTGTAEVLHHVLRQWQEQIGSLPEFCCCLYGTSAFITIEYLNEARRLLAETECIMAVSEFPHPVQRGLTLSALGDVKYTHPEYISMRTQDCTKVYHDIGLLYYFSVSAFFDNGGTSFLPLKKRAIIVPRSRSVDIDTEQDFEIAELLAKHLGLHK